MVQNTVGESVTGYIKRENLERLLRTLFGYPIRVRVRASIQVRG